MSGAELAGARVVLGVSGGIAAYKTAIIARLLVKADADVRVILTRGARRFVAEATFAGITGNPVRTEVWESPEEVPHVALARRADIIAVAPATAHVLAKAASGLADDLLSNVLLMATCPVVVAPAMHTEMWQHAATQANVSTLVERGVTIVGPTEGELAAGDVGEGRMVEPEDLVAAISQTHSRACAPSGAAHGDLSGTHVLVTAGPTREHLDPVRFLGNRSSGRMGFALAREAARRGANVELVAGPVDLETPAGVTRHDVVSARDMAAAVFELADEVEVVVKAAAVSDFRPSERSTQKIKKDAGPARVELERNPDILAELGRRRAERDGQRPVLVGFAAETEDVEEHGRRKLERKDADLVVVNDVSAGDAGFEVSTNRVVVLGRDGRRVDVPLSTKPEVARRVWDEIVGLLDGSRGAQPGH